MNTLARVLIIVLVGQIENLIVSPYRTIRLIPNNVTVREYKEKLGVKQERASNPEICKNEIHQV